MDPPFCFLAGSVGRRWAADNIKRDRRRVRHVQAFDRAGQVDAGDMIAGVLGELAQPLALGAEHQRQRRAQGKRGEIGLAAAVETDDEKAAGLERGKPAREISAR